MLRNYKRYRVAKDCKWTILVFAVLFFLEPAGFVFGATDLEKPAADRSRVYKLNYRTAEEIKNCLLELGIGRRVDALSENILIVTSDQPADLVQTTTILQILDKKTPRSMRQWKPAEGIGLPDKTYFLSRLNLPEINFGTLMDPPPANVTQPVIVESRPDALAVLSDEETLARIDALIQEWTEKRIEELAKATPAGKPDQPASSQTEAPTAAQKDTAEPNAAAAAEMELVLTPAPTTEAQPAQATQPAEQAGEEDFFSEELLKALSAAQEKAEDLHEAIETEKQKAAAAVQEKIEQEAEDQTEDDQAFQEIIEALRRKSEDQTEDLAPAAPKPAEPTAQTEPVTVPQASEAKPVSDLALLQEQLARQEQQIAELKALLTGSARQPEQKIQVSSQISEPQIPEGETELELTITLPERVEITWLLELIGKQLGLNYMYDPAQVKGDVTLKVHDGKIKVKDAYALLESVLRFRGFVMTRRGNLVTIVPTSQIKQAEPVIRSPQEPIEPGDVIVSSVFQLKNITPGAAQKMLTDMQLGTSFVIVAETNSLIVTDYTYRMDRIEQVITLVDVAGEPKTFQYRQLEYTTAADMVNKLKTLTAQIGGISVSGGAAATPQAAPVRAAPAPVQRDARGRVIPQPSGQPEATPPAAAAAGVQAQESVYLDTDERTNRIVMIGYAEQIKIINELIDTLDVPKYYIRYVREYFIQHIEAAEIVTAMNELGLAHVVVGDSSTTARTATPARQIPTRPGQPAQPVQPAQPAAAAAQAAAGEDQPYISIRPNTNSLLVNATKEQHDAIELVIMHVDVKQKDQRTIHEYEIQNVDALQIVRTLEDLGIISPGRSSRDTAASAARGGAGGRSLTGRQAGAAQQVQEPALPELPLALPTLEGETVRELTAAEPQIAILESTNSLLVNATPRQHTAISLIIAHVDRVLEQISTPYVIYPLENQDPDKLAQVLNELIQETIEQAQKSAPDAKIQTTGAPAAAALLPTREEERIRIISDPASYSLIVYGNKKNQQWVGELIKELDQYRPQVLLDCTLVEVTKQDDFNYALNIIHSIPDLDKDNTSGLTGTITRDSDKNPIVTAAQIFDKLNTAKDPRFIDLQSEAGSFTGFYGNDKIMALLTAMQTKKYGRILAKPKLLVDDNQEGTIETKHTTYIKRETTNFQNTQSGDPIQSTHVDFDPYDASIKMGIKPHISKGDNLRLEITLSRTDFLNFDSESNKPPDQSNSDVTTVVTVPDGSTIILGGMDKINQSKGGTKTPILGDLPLIGGLFRSTSNTNVQSKLYVFVRAYILRPGENMSSQDLKKISNEYRYEFEETESEMQKYEDWPGIKPTPMDPQRVLKEVGADVQVSEEESLY
jgi:general secretion pathway protein D